MTGKTYNFTPISQYYWIIGELGKNIKKTNIKNDVCLHSESIGHSCPILFLLAGSFVSMMTLGIINKFEFFKFVATFRKLELFSIV